MLRSLRDLIDYTVHAVDGKIGVVKDFYFDDFNWSVRYMIVGTGDGRQGRTGRFRARWK